MKNTTQPQAVVLQKFRQLLPEKQINDLALTSGFMVRRARKLTPLLFVVSFFMALSQQLTSLSGWAGQLFALCGERLTKQGLNSRLTKEAYGFAKGVFEQLLTHQSRRGKEVRRVLQNFTSILAQDSTTFALKDSLKEDFKGSVSHGLQKAVLRLKTIIELSTLYLVEAKVSCFSENDQSAASNIHTHLRTASLVLRDLGYWSMDSLQKIMARGAYFLSRYKYGVTLYTDAGSQLVLKDLLKGKVVDRWVRLSSAYLTAVRLVIVPVPSPVAEERIRSARKDRDQRCNHSEDYYQMLCYDIFVTNVGAQLCSVRQLQVLYRLRWQIEVWFRALKSGALNVAAMLTPILKNADRVRTVLVLDLCFLVLTVKELYLPFSRHIENTLGRFLSLTRVLRWLMANLPVFARLNEKELQEALVVYCCYEKRKRQCLPQKLQTLT